MAVEEVHVARLLPEKAGKVQHTVVDIREQLRPRPRDGHADVKCRHPCAEHDQLAAQVQVGAAAMRVVLEKREVSGPARAVADSSG